MIIRILFVSISTVSLLFSGVTVTNQGDTLEKQETIKIIKKEPPKKKNILKKDDCSFWSNPIDCTNKKYKDFVENNKSIKEVILGNEEELGVEEKTNVSISDKISEGASSLWVGTKNMFKNAGKSVSSFAKRKFNESWEEAEREVAAKKAARKKASENKK